jgi:hypothetical protein
MFAKPLTAKLAGSLTNGLISFQAERILMAMRECDAGRHQQRQQLQLSIYLIPTIPSAISARAASHLIDLTDPAHEALTGQIPGKPLFGSQRIPCTSKRSLFARDRGHRLRSAVIHQSYTINRTRRRRTYQSYRGRAIVLVPTNALLERLPPHVSTTT